MIKSERIYSPQRYLEAITGLCYLVRGEDDIEFIRGVLKSNGLNDGLWDYPLKEIDHIVENKINVVLVDCMVVNEDTNSFEHQYRWFEVPDDFTEEE